MYMLLACQHRPQNQNKKKLSIVAEGSISSVLDGKQYNRGVQLHKIVYEALMRVAWDGFAQWLANTRW
jgi:hypothetical protein